MSVETQRSAGKPRVKRNCNSRAFWATLAEVKTRLTTSPTEAAEFVNAGGTVAFPTETVYGLGADVFNELAIRKIFEAKNRPADNPLIAHIADQRDVTRLVVSVPAAARKLMDAFFPGPLTIVLTKTAEVSTLATAGLNTIGVRMPRHPVARAFLRACGTPVVAPSANLSGRPSPTTWRAVKEDLDGRVDCILQGDAAEIGLESTVVDCTAGVPVILRKGAVSIERMREIIPDAIDFRESADDIARSPGVRHKHYAPKAAVIIVDAGHEFTVGNSGAYIGLSPPYRELVLTRICHTVEEYASSLFEFFRECDRAGIERIFCEAVDEKGIGAALMDRIRRAAER